MALTKFEKHGWGIGGNKVQSVQYAYDDQFVFRTVGRTTTKAAITEEQNNELRLMSFNDYIGPAHVFAAASSETLGSRFAQFE